MDRRNNPTSKLSRFHNQGTCTPLSLFPLMFPFRCNGPLVYYKNDNVNRRSTTRMGCHHRCLAFSLITDSRTRSRWFARTRSRICQFQSMKQECARNDHVFYAII
jgi:hypothetical protein